MKGSCKTCAWRSYNQAKSEFVQSHYRCLNDESPKHRLLVTLRSRCKHFEYEPERIAS